LETIESSRIASDKHVAYYENGANNGTDVGQDECLVRRNKGMMKREEGNLR
jgi:hypothetical protein